MCILLARTVPAGFRGTGAAFRSVLSYINRKICIEKISPFSVKRHIEGDTMYEVDFSKPIHIHFIGIGGISMSGLAEILLKESFTISGSDAKESDLTRHLTSLGAQVFYGQKAENILPGTDLVVYTAAIHPDNPEFAAAKAAGVPMLTRAELLAATARSSFRRTAISNAEEERQKSVSAAIT